MAYELHLVFHAQKSAFFRWENEPPHFRGFGLSSSVPLSAENLPSSAVRTRGKQTPDIFPMPGLNAVSARFRALVESFEPGIHLFHPILLKEQGGRKVDNDYFIFCARVAIDFVLGVRSGISWAESRDGQPYPILEDQSWESHHPSHRNSEAKREERFGIRASAQRRGVPVVWPRHLFVSAPAISGHHLWTGDRLFPNGLWVSDAFFKAFEKSKLKSLVPRHYGFEVDEPWVAERELAPLLAWERARTRSD